MLPRCYCQPFLLQAHPEVLKHLLACVMKVRVFQSVSASAVTHSTIHLTYSAMCLIRQLHKCAISDCISNRWYMFTCNCGVRPGETA